MNTHTVITPINKTSLSAARENAPTEELVQAIADTFKALGDPTRVKIVSALLHQSLCVRDIAILINLSESAVSHQLRTLRQHKLVKTERQGNVIYYSIENAHVGRFFKEARSYIDHIKGGLPDHPDKQSL